MDPNGIDKYIHPLAPLPTSLVPGGKLKDRIRCVLFDIYGTLFISASGDIAATRQRSPRRHQIERLFAEFGITERPPKVLAEFHRTIEARHEELRRQGIDCPEVEIDRIWQQVLKQDDTRTIRQFALEFELIVNPVYPMPGLENMLSACRCHKVLMGLISNAQFYTPYLFRWFLNAEPTELGFDPELIFFSYRFAVAKPSPRLFETAAQKLTERALRPSCVLYLGNDMLNDIYPADMVGFQTALFAGDKRSLRLRSDDVRCKDLAADLVITDLKQLMRYLG